MGPLKVWFSTGLEGFAYAVKKQVSVAQIALAWLLHQDVVTSVIVGARRGDQLEDNIAATSVSLNQTEIVALNEVSALSKEYPGWMFEMQQARHD